tara:strand:- start:3323 stop:4249 length:927 start_codon:yes stop_codon:yes gene_type:complete
LKKNLCVIGSSFGRNVICEALKKSNYIKDFFLKYSDNTYEDLKKKKKFFYRKIEDFILENKIELFIIAVPPRFQFEYVKKISKFKIPIILEKPLGINIKQINQLKKLLGKNIMNHAIDFNFLTSSPFQYLIKKYLGNNTQKKIKVSWKVPKRKKNKSWKNQYEKGGGIENNFIIHIISIFVFCFKGLKVLKKSKKKRIFLRAKNKTDIEISYCYNNTEKNYFKFIIEYKNFLISMVNTGQNYHSGYKIIKYDKIKKSKNIKIFKAISNDRTKPFLNLFNSFYSFVIGKNINKYNVKLGFDCHKILDKI